MLRTAAQDLSRLRQIAGILARHGFRHMSEQIEAGKAPRPDDELRAEAQAVVGAPVRLRRILQDLGPTFVKLGQILSTRPDLVPTAFRKELAKLQDDVGALPFAPIRGQLERNWRGPIDRHLAWVDEHALATASIAQVHRARLHDGREVVLKVQRPDIEATIRADIDLLYLLARLLDATIEEMGLYRPMSVVQTFERALLDELDFTIEARNARTIASYFEGNEKIVIPAVITELSTREVLVLEYVAGGVKITDIDRTRHDPAEVVKIVLDSCFQQAFQDGLFHADPHPGNVLVLPDGRVCLLDYGLCGRLTSHMQQTLIQLALAIGTRDADSTTRLIYRIGQPMERIQLHEFRDQVADMMGRYLVRKLDEIDATSLINELLDMALRYKIRVPPDYALLAKAAVTAEGVIRTLQPDLDIAKTILPYAQKLMAERYSPQAVGQLALQSAVTLIDGAQHMPLVVHQLVSDLEAGRLTVRISNSELDKLSRSLNDLGTKVFLGMVTMALILGTFFVVARYRWEWNGWNLWAVFGSVAALWLVMMVGMWHILYTRLKKLSLRSLMAMWGRRR